MLQGPQGLQVSGHRFVAKDPETNAREARAVENDNLPTTHRLDSTATLPLYLSRARVVKLCKEAWISVGVARLQNSFEGFFPNQKALPSNTARNDHRTRKRHQPFEGN